MKPQYDSFDFCLLAGLVLLAFLILGPVLTIGLPIPINYNEGWNALFDTRAVLPTSGPLYPPADSFVFNNYPPFGFYVVGALGRFVFSDMIVAGRVAALISLLLAAALTALCVRLLGGAPRAALAAGLFLLLNMVTYYREYVAMDDPQWLAHAIMLAGLTVLLAGAYGGRLRDGHTPVSAIVGGALLMVAGGFVKHNLIALPLSVTLWLALLDRRAAVIWMLAAVLGVGIGLGVTALVEGQMAFTDILHHRRVFRLALWTHSIKRLAPLLPMAVAAALLLRRKPPGLQAGILFVAIFAPLALITGIVQRLGEGVYYNAHFETLIAICLGFGLALTAALETPIFFRKHGLGAASLAVFAALPLLGAMPFHLAPAWHDITERQARVAAWKPVIARIAAADGPAGCLFMSLCYWAGKQSEVDVFNLTQSVLAGGPLEKFQAAVASRHFAIFEDDPASFTHSDAVRKLGHDPIMEAFAGRYAATAHGPDGIVLLAPTPQ